MENKVGRPLKFKSAQELQEKIDDYFKVCARDNRPLTISGLAVHLGTFRSVLMDYEEKDEFSNTIKAAKEKIMQWTEEAALSGKTNTVFTIFSMKNNFGWVDKQEVTQTHNINVGLNVLSNQPAAPQIEDKASPFLAPTVVEAEYTEEEKEG